MDVAANYKQHSSQARRKNRSATNLNHLSLAPLTTKLPLNDPDALPDFTTTPLSHNSSYLVGKSAPTTPRLLQSPSHTRANSPRRRASIPDAPGAATALGKSKSTTHLHVHRASRNGLGLSPIARRHPESDERRDSDWVLRTGVLISAEARESKGQAWLVSRTSATSLTGMRDVDEEALERELARERELVSRRSSRHGSIAGGPHDLEDLISPCSRFGSRSHSRVGSRSQLRTPLRTPGERFSPDGYFAEPTIDESIPGPDFVSLDEKLEAIELDTSAADEQTVRKLVSRRSDGVGAWMWSLFAVDEENDEEEDSDAEDDEPGSGIPRSASTVDFQGFSTLPELQVSPPPKGEQATWQDAAWLLSVASKVLL